MISTPTQNSFSEPLVDHDIQCVHLEFISGSFTGKHHRRWPLWVTSSLMSFLLTSLFIVNAKIDFPAGLDVEWQGNTFGNIKMDAVQVTGDVGATLDIDSTFKVINPGTLTEFTKVCILVFFNVDLFPILPRRSYSRRSHLSGQSQGAI